VPQRVGEATQCKMQATTLSRKARRISVHISLSRSITRFKDERITYNRTHCSLRPTVFISELTVLDATRTRPAHQTTQPGHAPAKRHFRERARTFSSTPSKYVLGRGDGESALPRTDPRETGGEIRL